MEVNESGQKSNRKSFGRTNSSRCTSAYRRNELRFDLVSGNSEEPKDLWLILHDLFFISLLFHVRSTSVLHEKNLFIIIFHYIVSPAIEGK